MGVASEGILEQEMGLSCISNAAAEVRFPHFTRKEKNKICNNLLGNGTHFATAYFFCRSYMQINVHFIIRHQLCF